MSAASRASVLGLLVLVLFPQTGCNMVPQQTLRQSQLRSWQLAGQNRQLNTNNVSLKSNLDVSNQRLTNLHNERTLLHQRYLNLLKQQSPLSQNATQRLEELRRQFPRFQFDPQSGVCKIGNNDDILFTTGSAQLNNKVANNLLMEFARIMNEGDAKELNILVVGHTDDRRVAKANTKTKHPTNWHLSTNRANAVVVALMKHGINESRLGAAGYGVNQPLVSNSDEKARQKNRRVEIFVLSPDAVVAHWQPGTSPQ